jgi:hypothetical protein
VLSVPLAREVRRFTGWVSQEVLEDPGGRVVLEHPNRLSHRLSGLLRRHVETQVYRPEEFLELVDACEQVNITTDEENHRVQGAGGDYAAAGIRLVAWADVPAEVQIVLWPKLRRGVCNAAEFRPAAIDDDAARPRGGRRRAAASRRRLPDPHSGSGATAEPQVRAACHLPPGDGREDQHASAPTAETST